MASTPRPHLLIAVLAAGEGNRFDGDGHKLLASLRGAQIVHHALSAAVTADIGPVVVITGAVDITDVPPGVEVVHNDQWRSGQRSSVLAALIEGERRGVDAVVIGLADQPFIGSDAWRRVGLSDAPLAMADFDGQPSPPVRFARELWHTFKELAGDPDEGLRSLVRLHPELVRRIACEGSPADIDTMEDLSQWT
ncbi:MAG: NTP transferase domain-containing protein [Actinomycetota bacterium]